MSESMDRTDRTDIQQFIYDKTLSLYGRCGHCKRLVDNYDDKHRVTSVMRGGKGVECVVRGDIESQEAAPLANHPSTLTRGEVTGE